MRKFGLIGFPLGHSFSRKYFSAKFETEGKINCLYSNYEIADIALLPGVLADPELEGLNVTIPYKKSVLALLDDLHPVVAETGACNCIRIRGGKKEGYNTDVTGFELSLREKCLPADREALVLGTGGSSVAVGYVLRKMGIRPQLVSRSPRAGAIGYSDITETLMRRIDLIVNCTPLGMFPHTAAAPPIPYQWLRPDQYLFDLIYNPAKTKFLEAGEAVGARTKNGQDMLVVQAEASWRIWNS